MIKVADKEVLFHASFMLGPDEQAILTPAETPGLRFEFTAKKTAARSVDDFKIEAENNAAKLTLPYIDDSSLSSAFGLGDVGPGKLSGRVIGHGAGNFMMIHVEVYLERTLNYGMR